jgi:cyclic pyranopterin phosphate synthase
MPKEIFGPDYPFLRRDELLTFDEMDRLARLFAEFGVRKIRLTGGEPLLRPRLEQLVARLAAIEGLQDISMTTNGSILASKAEALSQAGLQRVSVSLDALDPGIFAAMNDVDFEVERVLAGIDAAEAAGLTPLKINMVVKRGVNDGEILPMVRHFHGSGHILRFIEYMDVGNTNGWRMNDVLPAKQVVERINAEFPLAPMEENYRGEVANRYRFLDGSGEVGVIASVTQPFCADCTRARLSADGQVYTCLFAGWGHDLKGALRTGAADDELRKKIQSIWENRSDRYSEERAAGTAQQHKVEMHFIGG